MIFRTTIFCVLWLPSLLAQPQDRKESINKPAESEMNLKLSGREVMTKLVDAIQTNYPYSPLVHSAILTEKETLKKGGRLYTSKALVEYMRNGYFDPELDRIRLISGHNDVHIDSLFRNNMFGGLSQIRKDIIKYPSEFLDLKNSSYTFKVGQIEIDNKLFFKVELIPVNSKAKYKGFLFVEPVQYALVKAEISLTDFGLKLLNRIQVKNSFEWRSLTEIINYKKQDHVKQYLSDDDRYHLSSITTIGNGEHLDWKTESEVTNTLRIISTNRTTFFANEYERLDDNIALTKLNFGDDERP